MANQLQKFDGQITTGLDLDLLWSILQNTGGSGGGIDVSALNKEDTQIEVKNAINALTTQLHVFKTSNTNENALINKEATQLSVLTQINALITQIVNSRTANTNENALINKEATQINVLNAINNLLLITDKVNIYNVSNANLIVALGSTNGANTYAGKRSKMIARVTAGTVTIVAGSPPGAVWQFWQNSNRNNLQTTLPVGVWVCDTVPNYFSIIANGGTCEVTLYS